jgi:hypothetical protein
VKLIFSLCLQKPRRRKRKYFPLLFLMKTFCLLNAVRYFPNCLRRANASKPLQKRSLHSALQSWMNGWMKKKNTNSLGANMQTASLNKILYYIYVAGIHYPVYIHSSIQMCDIAIQTLVKWKWFEFEFRWEVILMKIDADIQRKKNIQSASKSLGKITFLFHLVYARGGLYIPYIYIFIYIYMTHR